MKTFELISLTRDHSGAYVASMYNRLEGYFTERRFLYYAKKEVLYKLRHDEGCTVARGF